MELRLDQIHKYLHCPAEYMLKYEKNVPYEEPDSVKYKRALHRTIYYLYYSMLGGTLPTQKQMKDKWASIWQEEKDGGALAPTEIILKDRMPREKLKVDKHIVQGFELIHNFYHMNKDNFGIPIAVNHEFRVPIAGVTVVGNFELIRESLDKDSPNRFIEIVDFKTGSDSTTDRFFVDNDLNLTIMAYAFRNLFMKVEDRITYNYMKTGKEIYTGRGEKDFDRMKAIVEGVAEGIVNKRFYPRQTFMCKQCPVQDACVLNHF